MIVVMMGVSGCGKTSVGRALAAALGWPFIEGDDYHPPDNVAKMAAGVPLDDADRWPWLDRLADEIGAIAARGDGAVLACSALKQSYRDRLVARAPPGAVRFVHLTGDFESIAARLAKRHHRYMPASLLASQFATLEPPVDAIVVDLRDCVADRVDAIRAALGSGHAAAVVPAKAGTERHSPDDTGLPPSPE